jgi:signal transduction histidine kinase
VPEIVKGAELFLPAALVEQYRRKNAYLVTPGWLVQWQEQMACQGLSRATAREMFGESMKEIVLIDTDSMPEIRAALDEFAEFLDLPATTLPVGLDLFRLLIESRYYAWRAGREKSEGDAEINEVTRKSANYAMVLDLLESLAGLQSEEALIRNILDVYTLLFSPERVSFIPLKSGIAGTMTIRSFQSPDLATGAPVFPEFRGDYEIAKTADGFFQALQYNSQRIGIIAAERVTFPQYIHEYLNTSQFISTVCSLSLANARMYQELKDLVTERDREIGERTRVEEALSQASNKLGILNSITRHDILNQLTGLRIYLELSKEDTRDKRMLEYIEKEEQAAEAIRLQIEFTRNYQDIGTQAPRWQAVPDLIGSAVRQLKPAGVEINPDLNGVEIFADLLLEKVFYNLMENSRRHGGHVTRMDFSARETESGLVMTYEDNGVGITAEDKKMLFRKGFGKNTGLGLFLSQEILAITRITITENGVPGTGVRFEITVPKGAYRYMS